MANEIWQQIVELYESGLSVRQIKERLVIQRSDSTVSRWLRDAGLTRKHGGSRLKYPMIMPLAKELYLKGFNTREIAERFGIIKGTVERWIQIWGIGRKGGVQVGQCKEKHPSWRGGTAKIDALYRTSKEYREWRLSVFERDKFCCCSCGNIGGELNAHHILPFRKYLSLRLDINNGVTLCKDCHNKVHHRSKYKQVIA